MQIVPVSRIDDNVSFRGICGLCQSWRDRETYGGYLTAPRQHHGLFEIRCREVVITDAAGDSLRCRCGDVVYLPKGAVYKTTFLSDTPTAETLLVNFDAFAHGSEAFFADGIRKLTTLAPPAVADCFAEIAALTRGAVAGATYVLSAFYRLLGLLGDAIERERLAADSRAAELYPALDYLNRHIDENTGIARLGRMCAMSETNFRKRFKAYTGLAPAQYRLRARLEKAERLLADSDATIESIALDLGFYDTAYFCKVFRRQTGRTPVRYRREYAAADAQKSGASRPDDKDAPH